MIKTSSDIGRQDLIQPSLVERSAMYQATIAHQNRTRQQVLNSFSVISWIVSLAERTERSTKSHEPARKLLFRVV